MINTTDLKEYMAMKEKLYNMYNKKYRSSYGGSIKKIECTINNERGLFKERFSISSRDHIMEQFIYEFATILGVQCCKAYCRKSNNMYGSFSRFEVADLSNVIHYSNVTNKTDMLANEILDATIKLQGGINSFVVQLYQIIIFDYITAQHDRHLENLSIYRTNSSYIWYPLYDNGLCCFSFEDNEHANNSLKRGFFQGRMGGSLEILETLNEYRDLIFIRFVK